MPRVRPSTIGALLAMVLPALSLGDEAGRDSTPAAPAASGGGLGGPSSVSAQITQDADQAQAPGVPSVVPRSDPVADGLDRLDGAVGLRLGFDYNALYQWVSRSPASQNAAAQAIRLYGTWTLVNRGMPDPGYLVFKGEYRGTLGTALSPQALGTAAGYAGTTATTFSDAGLLLTNLFWNQSFWDNRFAFVAGVVDVTDYVDVYALVSPWTDFNNLSFSTNPTIPSPNQGLGAAVRVAITPSFYFLGGMADANGNPHDSAGMFESFFGAHEYFFHAELGWVGSFAARYSENVHVTLWGQMPREAQGIDRGLGVTISASETFGGRWTPFLRAGFSDGGGPFLDRMVSTGVGILLDERGDFAGFGAGWGRAPGSSANQLTFETYVRVPVLRHLQIVPDAQFIVNPANAPGEGSLWFLGAKLRLAY